LYCEGLVIEDYKNKKSKEYLKNEKQELLARIKEIDQEIKSLKEDPILIKQILEHGFLGFNRMKEDPAMSPGQIKKWISSQIVSELKKANCNRYDENKIFDIYMEGKTSE